jgi:CDP-diacylglycerol--serine O-phosphatidyltransferase
MARTSPPPGTERHQIDDAQIRLNWLPSAVTCLGLFLGCLALVAAFNGQYKCSAWLIYGSLLCDVLDGLAARSLGTSSAFGKELDSLSDFVTFGVIPASLIYSVGLRPLGLFGVVPVGSFVIAAAVRLARFNLLSAAGRSSSTRFVGLPVPGAAAIMASVAFASQNAPHLAPQILCALVFVLTMALSALMISPIPYPALKIARPGPVLWIIVVAGLSAAAIAWLVSTGLGALFFATVYVLWGPFLAVQRKLRSDRRPPRASLINTIDRPPASGFYYGAENSEPERVQQT